MIQLARSGFFMEHSAFERVRQKLLCDPHDGRLDEVLGRWVRPDDRSLPLGFLGWTLRELLLTPFQHLKETRGVGPKKISCLIELLERAAGLESEGCETTLVPGSLRATTSSLSRGPSPAAEIELTATGMSPTEVIWDQWRAAVTAHGLGPLTLGRLAHSLRELPRPMWHTPLSSYADLTLDDLCRLHAHGERRLSAIFLIFCSLYTLIGERDMAGHLCVTVEPKFVRQLDGWTKRWLNSSELPGPDEVNRGFVTPIVEQLRIDAGDSLAEMALACIGASHPTPRLLDIGRARPRFDQNWYYLDKMQAIINARWIEGAARVDELVVQLRARRGTSLGLDLLRASISVFFSPARNEIPATGNG
jgi:hypothetical protein